MFHSEMQMYYESKDQLLLAPTNEDNIKKAILFSKIHSFNLSATLAGSYDILLYLLLMN